MASEPGIRIPIEELPEATLHSVIEEFVTRDGTNLVDADVKVAQVRAALEKGTADIWFDPETKTCTIVASGS